MNCSHILNFTLQWLLNCKFHSAQSFTLNFSLLTLRFSLFTSIFSKISSNCADKNFCALSQICAQRSIVLPYLIRWLKPTAMDKIVLT